MSGMVRRFSVAITTDVADKIGAHLRRLDGQEECCFLLWKPSAGASRTTALITGLVLPGHDDRIVHGTVDFTSAYFLRAAAEAAQQGCGLGFVHSHPRGRKWQRLNGVDFAAESAHAAQTVAITGHSLVGMTFAGADSGYGARLWQRVRTREYAPIDAENIRIVGRGFDLTWNDRLVPPPVAMPGQVRTVSAWSPDSHADLTRAHVGVVGCGSVGMIIVEALARSGFTNLSLFDFDTVEEINLDRLLHASRRDVRFLRSKVHLARRSALASSTAHRPAIAALDYSVVEPAGFAAALDCDVLFSCVDRPWPRAVLNLIAYAHLIPVVDGGIRVMTRNGRLQGAEWRSHIAAPHRACLECLGQYDPAHVAAERDGSLDDSTYLAGLPAAHPLRQRENVFAFSAAAAASELMQFLAMALAPSGVSDTGAHLHHMTTGVVDRRELGCSTGCPYSNLLVATGDDAGVVVTGRHEAAQRARAHRASAPTWRVRLARVADDLLWRLR
jgi:molybdopterin-synthase adenylyltransferase